MGVSLVTLNTAFAACFSDGLMQLIDVVNIYNVSYHDDKILIPNLVGGLELGMFALCVVFVVLLFTLKGKKRTICGIVFASEVK